MSAFGKLYVPRSSISSARSPEMLVRLNNSARPGRSLLADALVQTAMQRYKVN
jgi:hypothetical protein